MLQTRLRKVLLLALATVIILTTPGLASGWASRFETPEVYGKYQPQVSCDPVAKPGVLSFRRVVHRKFGGGDLGIVRSCSVGGQSEHKEGRAWDYALNYYNAQERATGNAVVKWLSEPVQGQPGARALRFGVMYMIWNNQIWSAYNMQWRPYTGASPHRDHIHFSFTWNGATKQTSWWRSTNKTKQPFDYGPCARWNGELANPWRSPRLNPCPTPINRPVQVDGYYKAQEGESIARVARFFSKTRKQIRRWNGYPLRYEIPVGSEVRVTKPAVIPPKIGTEPTPPPPTSTPTPTPDTTSERVYHTVQDGDNLWRLAYKYNTSVQQVQDWNNLDDWYIEVGQKLRVS